MKLRGFVAAIAIAMPACGEDEGLISVSLTSAPGSTLLESVQSLRLVITNPRRELTAERQGGGFQIAVDLEASGVSTALFVDGFDAAGNLIASGASPRFALGGVDGHVAVYMGAPNSVGAAPTALDPPRSALASAPLPYGAIFAGGTLASGTPTDAVAVYNSYDHTLLAGRPLPAPRSGAALGVGTLGVYIFGGRDETGALSSSLLRFDPSVAPAGTYFDYGTRPDFARTGQQLVPLGNDRFLLTGTPGAILLGGDGSLAAVDGLATLPAAGVTVIANDGLLTSIFAGEAGITRCRGVTCATLALPGRAGAVVVGLPAGKVGVVCGPGDMLRIDAATGTAESFAAIPATPRSDCAAAVTSRHLLIAGGTTAAGLSTEAEVYDAATLTLVATTPLAVPRTGAHAIALENDQVLIGSGLDVLGQPIATLELFTPENPI